MGKHTHAYRIPMIPDVRDYRYARLDEGSVSRQISAAAQHVLRSIARFSEKDLTCQIRAIHNPDAVTLKGRLSWWIVVHAADTLSDTVTKSLTTSGPLGPFYDYTLSDAGLQGIDYSQFTAVCEILRCEEAVHPIIPTAKNRYIDFDFYHAVHPFESQDQNDYLLLDRFLSGVSERVLLEMMVSPVDVKLHRSSLLAWISRLMAINAYSDQTFVPGLEQELDIEESFFDHHSDDLAKRVLKIRDPLADEFLRENKKLFANLRKPQLRFAIKVFAENPETSRSVASTVGESGLAKGEYQLVGFSRGEPGFDSALRESQDAIFLDTPFDEALFEGAPEEDTRQRRMLVRTASAEELSGLFRFPIAGDVSPKCMGKSTDPVSVEPTGSVLVGYDLEAGPNICKKRERRKLHDIFDGPETGATQLRLPLDLFNKHMFVSGAPGSGKTTAVFNLLVQLYRHGKPFLVIEPAKTEYRLLKTLEDHEDEHVRSMANNLRVFTPGNETISPLRFNPFAHPEGITRDEHISQMMSCFKAGMSLWGPLEAIISESLEEVYRDIPAGRSWPTMVDLVDTARRVMSETGYKGDAQSNIQAAIEVRLGSLARRSIGSIFSSDDSYPSIAHLLKYPTIIELEYMDNDTGCLFTLFLLSALREQIRETPEYDGDLQHIIVIEEAHNIVGRTGAAISGENVPDSKAFAAAYISRMLAELRALGEGIVIADQLPSAVAPEVIKNTGAKIAGRLVSEDDRQDLGGTMLLSPSQTREMARLEPGEMFLYHEQLHSPRRIQTLNAKEYLEPKSHPTGKKILPFLKEKDWFQVVLQHQITHFLTVLDAFNRKKQSWLGDLQTAQGWVDDKEKSSVHIDRLKQKSSAIPGRLEREYKILYAENYEPLVERISRWGNDDAVERMREVRKAVEEVNAQIETLLSNLSEMKTRIGERIQSEKPASKGN